MLVCYDLLLTVISSLHHPKCELKYLPAERRWSVLWLYLFLRLQCGFNAFGLQRAGDWQEEWGKEASKPRRQEERAGWEAWHGLWKQEVTSQQTQSQCVGIFFLWTSEEITNHIYSYDTATVFSRLTVWAYVSCSSAVSHSVMSEMQVIEQESPVGAKTSSRSKLDMFDEPGFTSGPPKYIWHP